MGRGGSLFGSGRHAQWWVNSGVSVACGTAEFEHCVLRATFDLIDLNTKRVLSHAHGLRNFQTRVKRGLQVGCQIECKCCDSYVNSVVVEQCSQLELPAHCSTTTDLELTQPS